MTTVNVLLAAKRGEVITISPDATVFEALEIMASKDIGALVVTEGDSVVGMFSERDYARKVFLLDRRSKETAIKEIMSKEVAKVRPDETIDRCMAIFTAGRFRHLPVVGKDGSLVGIISIGDAVKAVIEDQAFHIDQMKSYINGT
jgi:CBS domain-containing protein